MYWLLFFAVFCAHMLLVACNLNFSSVRKAHWSTLSSGDCVEFGPSGDTATTDCKVQSCHLTNLAHPRILGSQSE